MTDRSGRGVDLIERKVACATAMTYNEYWKILRAGVAPSDLVISRNPGFLEDGVWIRPFGDIIYVAPPFVIASEELARLTRAIVRHVSAWSQQRAAA